MAVEMDETRVIQVFGDTSHLAILDTERYVSFVSGAWGSDNRLRKHLVEQFRRETAIVWGTDFQADWKIAVRAGFSGKTGFREFQAIISTHSGQLHIANYDSLTMAAQFEDYTLPDEETSSYSFKIPPGRHKVRVVQVVDPKLNWWETLGEEEPAFIVEYEAGSVAALTDVPWAAF